MEEKTKETLLNTDDTGDTAWYFRWWVILLAILGFGPLGLFLVWFRPDTNLYLKLSISLAVILLAIWTAGGTMGYYRHILSYCREMSGIQ